MSTFGPAPPHTLHRPLAGTLAIAIVIAGLAGIILIALSQQGTHTIVGSGQATTQVRSVPPFTGLELQGIGAVTIRVGGRRSVVVRADDNLQDRITTRVRAGVLAVGTRGSVRVKTPVRVAVTVPALDGILLAGAGTVDAVGVRGGRLHVDLAGSGSVRATGSVARVDVMISGAGHAALTGLVARAAAVSVSGVGAVDLGRVRRLRASVSGSGSITYSGHPTMTTSVSGVGSIHPR